MYVDHLITISGKANDIARESLSFIHDNESYISLQALGCDGCPCNMGKRSGIIRSIEVSLDRPLKWLVCKFLYRMTTSPNSFKVPISKAIHEDLRMFRIANFQLLIKD